MENVCIWRRHHIHSFTRYINGYKNKALNVYYVLNSKSSHDISETVCIYYKYAETDVPLWKQEAGPRDKILICKVVAIIWNEHVIWKYDNESIARELLR